MSLLNNYQRASLAGIVIQILWRNETATLGKKLVAASKTKHKDKKPLKGLITEGKDFLGARRR